MTDSRSPIHDKSIPYFRHSKVYSCNQVVLRNGQPVAIPHQSMNPNAQLLYSSKPKPFEKLSISHDSHRLRQKMHAGMIQKPLSRYSPNAARSRLRPQQIPIYHKNTSQLVLGEPFRPNTRHFLTTAQNLLKFPQQQYTSNTGIISEKTKWKKHQQWS